MSISRRYRLSKDITGIVVAVGNGVPELTTTLLSFLKHGVKLAEFGVASNIGCAVLAITVVPAVAILATYKPEKKGDNHVSNMQEERQQKTMMMTIYRDMGFFILALVLYDIILYKGMIYMHEACLLIAVLFLYIATIIFMNRCN
jgi:Ca2+/Na+ antiporter